MITYRDLLISLWKNGNKITEPQFRNILIEKGIFSDISLKETKKAINEGYIIKQDNQWYLTDKTIEIFK